MSQKKRKIKSRIFLITMTSLIVMWGLVFSFPSDYLNFAIAASDDEDDKEKEEEAEEIEDDVENLEDDLEKALKEKAVKEQEKLLISNELWAIRKNITVVEADIEETGNEIKKLEREIVEAIDEIALKKKLMGAILRQINRTNRELQLIAYGKESGLSEYFSIVDGLENMEGKLSTLIVEVRQKKEDLEKQRIKQKEG